MYYLCKDPVYSLVFIIRSQAMFKLKISVNLHSNDENREENKRLKKIWRFTVPVPQKSYFN
jgi:hypothetical protein